MPVSAVQSENAPSPIVVMLSGRMIFDSDAHFEKA